MRADYKCQIETQSTIPINKTVEYAIVSRKIVSYYVAFKENYF